MSAPTPPPAPRTPRQILLELLDTRLEPGAAWFAELRDLLEFAAKAGELRERSCPRLNCTWKRNTTAKGLEVHIGRMHKGETF